MSRSWVRSEGWRGQTEPLAALAAVFAFGAALTVYAAGLGGALPGEPARDRDLAEPTLDRVLQAVAHDGVIDPANLSTATAVAPEGYRIRVTLRAGGENWTAGPGAPPDAERATRRVSVRFWPGQVDAGRIRVEVWS